MDSLLRSVIEVYNCWLHWYLKRMEKPEKKRKQTVYLNKLPKSVQKSEVQFTYFDLIFLCVIEES